MSPEITDFEQSDPEAEIQTPDQVALNKLASLYLSTEGGINFADSKTRNKFLKKQKDIKFSREARVMLATIDARNPEDFLEKADALLNVKKIIDEENDMKD